LELFLAALNAGDRQAAGIGFQRDVIPAEYHRPERWRLKPDPDKQDQRCQLRKQMKRSMLRPQDGGQNIDLRQNNKRQNARQQDEGNHHPAGSSAHGGANEQMFSSSNHATAITLAQYEKNLSQDSERIQKSFNPPQRHAKRLASLIK
jgi:hypothetical protein